jgi:Fe-S-cluster containining protein
LAATYAAGLWTLDRAFESARRAPGLVVPCGRGCSACCAAVFDVQPADALLLRLWLVDRDPDERAAVEARAAEVLAAVQAAAERLAAMGESALAGWTPADGLTALPAAAVTRLAGAVDLACPLLDASGACRAHASRPALCRLQGLPWRDPVTGTVLPDHCRLDERMGANAIQDLDLAALDGLRHETAEDARRLGLASPRGRTFVAAALSGEATEGALRAPPR